MKTHVWQLFALLAARKYDVISLRQSRGPKQNIFTKKGYVVPGSTTADFVNVKKQTNFT